MAAARSQNLGQYTIRWMRVDLRSFKHEQSTVYSGVYAYGRLMRPICILEIFMHSLRLRIHRGTITRKNTDRPALGSVLDNNNSLSKVV